MQDWRYVTGGQSEHHRRSKASAHPAIAYTLLGLALQGGLRATVIGVRFERGTSVSYPLMRARSRHVSSGSLTLVVILLGACIARRRASTLSMFLLYSG